MKKRFAMLAVMLVALTWAAAGQEARADDTCTFMTTANDIPPNIVILLDNGAAMEEIVWRSGYALAGRGAALPGHPAGRVRLEP